MSTSIDERIVSMAFENAKFEQGVAQTMHTLTKLDQSLQQIGAKNSIADIEKAANKVTLTAPMSALDKLKSRLFGAGDGAAQGLGEIERAGNKVQLEQPVRAIGKVQSDLAQIGRGAPDAFNEIERASNRVSLQGLNAAMDSVTAKFSVLQGAATVALGNIQSQAVMKSASFAKSFAMGPIMQGLEEYQVNLKSIQTIMANTEGQKVSGLGATNKHLDELNTYADQTIYNFSEMAKNIGTFTAAGVDLPRATASIKGIANLAALSGSTSQQASTAMYQLSQAIASGRVSLQDWNSVVNAGMGGAKFQKALMATASTFGELEKGAVKIDKATGKATVNGLSFRESIMAKPGQKSWLSEKVLVETLKQFTGDMNAAELAAQGFTKEQIKSIMATAKSAKNAATEVKTLPQVFEVAREAIGSGWAKTFQHIFGDFNQAKKLFTGMSNAINGFIGQNAEARNKVLKEWNKEGGRTALIEGLKNGFKALFAILKPIGEAFRDIFPKKTADDLISMSKSFQNFTENLKPGPALIDGIKRTFRGLFAVLHIGWEVVKGVIGVITDLLGVVGKGSGGFLNFTGSIGDFLVALDTALTKGGLLTSFFDGIAQVLKLPLQLLGGIANAIFGLFGGIDVSAGDKMSNSMKGLGKEVTPLKNALLQLEGAWKGFLGFLSSAKEMASPWLDTIGEKLSGLGDVISRSFSGENLDKAFSALQTGFIGGIFLALKKAFSSGVEDLVSPMRGLNDVLNGLSGQLQVMQTKVKSQIILNIAAALALLTGSIFMLAKVDGDKLASSMTAITVGLGQLAAVMFLMGNMMKGAGAVGIVVGMPILSASLLILAGAVVVLAGAMKIFSTMNWEELAKGVVGIFGSLLAIALGIGPIAMMAPMFTILAPALVLIAAAMNILALAVKQFGSMDWGDLAKGMVGMLGSLVALSLGLAPMALLAPALVILGPALIALAFALNMIAGAVKAFGAMGVGELAKGIGGIAASLLLIGIATWALPPHLPLVAAGLLVLAVALTGVAAAVAAFGTMSIGEMAKGLVAMGLALGILAVGLTAMIVALPGAAALAVAAAALALLAPTLAFLGTLKWSTILSGLAAMGLLLGTLAVAGSVAAPGLMLLGLSLLPLAGAFALAASGAFTLSKALQVMAGEGLKGVGIMVAAITAFVALLPKILIDLLKGLVDVIVMLAQIMPKVTEAMIKILEQIIAVVLRSAPSLGVAIGVLVDTILVVLAQNAPKIIAAGWRLILDLLKGLDSNLPAVLTKAGNVVVKFLEGLASQAPRIIAAGGKFLLSYISGITSQIPALVAAAVRAVSSFLVAVGQNIGKVVAAGIRLVVGFLEGIAKNIGKVYSAGARVLISLMEGLSQQIPKLVNKGVEIAGRFLRAVANGLVGLVDVGATALINFLNGLAEVIRTRGKELRQAGWNVADAILDGLVAGFKDLGRKAIEAVKGVFKSLPGAAKKVLDIHSPSGVFKTIGEQTMEGLYMGLSNQTYHKKIKKAAIKPLEAMIKETDGVKDIGKFIGTEFMNGLNGGLWGDGKTSSQKALEGTFASLKDKLIAEQDKLAEQIKAGQDKMPDLIGARNEDEKQIADVREKLLKDRKELEAELRKKKPDKGRVDSLVESLNDSQKELTALLAKQRTDAKAIMANLKEIHSDKRLLQQSKAATDEFLASLKDEQDALIGWGNEYEKVAESLDKAKSALDEATKARDDAFKSYTDQYSQLPDISGLLNQAMDEAKMTVDERLERDRKKREDDAKRAKINQVAEYKKALREQIAATTKYMDTLGKLRAAGLDDVTYKKLLGMGTAGQEFASQLLQSGPKGIEELSKLDAELAKAAHELAKNAATDLYQAGVDAAQGLVDGLKQRQEEIKWVMNEIANSMVAQIKGQLGIRSPSRIFAEIGKFATQGLAQGLRSSSQVVGAAAASIGDDAASALTNSLANLSTEIQNGIDTDLTITPVLDLSQVQKDASKMRDLANVTPITAAASFGQASAIAREHLEVRASAADAAEQKIIDFKFEQNNTSPKALDEIEIYRQTNNQLSQVKRALGIPA